MSWADEFLGAAKSVAEQMTSSETEGWKIQGSPEWKASRVNYLGASECAAVLGLNTYKTAQHVMNEKLGKSDGPTENYHMRRGNELEGEIVKEAIEHFSRFDHEGLKEGAPDVEVSKDYPFIRASYDYISREARTGIEVKAPEKIYDDLPKMYWVQCQIQMLVSGFDVWLFYARDVEGRVLQRTVKRDQEFIDEALPKLKAFWDTKEKDGNLFFEAEAKIEDEKFVSLVEELMELEATVKPLEKRIDAIRAEVRAALHADETRIGKYVARITSAKGNVNYSKIPELKGVDLEKYRGAAIKRMKIEEWK